MSPPPKRNPWYMPRFAIVFNKKQMTDICYSLELIELITGSVCNQTNKQVTTTTHSYNNIADFQQRPDLLFFFIDVFRITQ